MSGAAAVLDASVTAPWFLPDEASEASDRAYALMRRGTWVFHAPELWIWECGNILVNAVRRQRLTKRDALLAWSAVDSIRTRVEIDSPEPAHAASSLEFAVGHGLSIYDGAYLRLAFSSRLPLITSDRALASAASATGVRVMTMEDLG